MNDAAFHGDVGVFVRDAVGDIPNDAGMLERREDFGFAIEAFAIGFFVEEDFDRDKFIGGEIERPEDARHPALADEGFQAKASANDLPDLHAEGSIVVKRARV